MENNKCLRPIKVVLKEKMKQNRVDQSIRVKYKTLRFFSYGGNVIGRNGSVFGNNSRNSSQKSVQVQARFSKI